MIEADNIIRERNINVNDYVLEKEIDLYKNSLIVDEATVPLTVIEKILAFLSSWIIYFVIRFILTSLSGIPLYISNTGAFLFTIGAHVIIFKYLKDKGFTKRSTDFKSWVLNAYIVMAGLFLLDRIMSFLF